jgi:hypothetical protein
LQAVRDANKDMSEVTCVKAFTQVADVSLVYVKISGDVNGTTMNRECRLQRLRTKAGGRTAIHKLRAVYLNGTSADSEKDLDAIKEKNRYQIDDCISSSSVNDLMHLAAPKSDNTPSLGLLDVSDEQWAQLRVHTATQDALRDVPDEWDERNVYSCPNAQAIQSQGPCGAFLRVPSPRLECHSGTKLATGHESFT